MLFSSLTFLYFFLPAALGVYYLTPARGRNAALLLASLVFYAWGEPRFVPVMLFGIVQSYLFARLIDRDRAHARLWLLLSLFLSLGTLFVFKYADFFLQSVGALTHTSVPLLKLALPLGVSFYTFQTLSYVVDVYRGRAAQKSLLKLAAYIAMFPQLIAGPIVRYTDVAPQLDARSVRLCDAAAGAQRFVLGLGKKVLLATVLSVLADTCAPGSAESVLSALLGAAAFTLQIYFDFSGYSDMAIGLGLLLGFRFAENFRYPYCASSLTDFWRRWHISLGSWFRDYVYIPLGGNRVSRPRWLLNLFIVWALTGLWHGAAWNFVLWGLFFAVFLALEKLFLGQLLEKTRVLKHVYVLVLVALGFVLFQAENLPAAVRSLSALLGFSSLPFSDARSLYLLQSYAPTLLLAALGATPLPAWLAARLQKSRLSGLLFPAALAALLVLCTAFLVSGSSNPFLYFRF